MTRIFIMLCSAATAGACFEKKLFGSGANMAELLRPLQRDDEGFLYHYELDVLFGPFRATTGIGCHEPSAWRPQRFPIQFRVEWSDLKQLHNANAVFRALGVRLSRFGEEARYEVPSHPILYGNQASGLANKFARATGAVFRTVTTVEQTSKPPNGETLEVDLLPVLPPQVSREGRVVRIDVGEVNRFIDQQIGAGVIGSFENRPGATLHSEETSGTEEEKICVTPEFEDLFALLERETPFTFLTGKAGTGKSTLIDLVRKRFAALNVAVVAPTGIAALNAEGQTINSFFGIRPNHLDDIRRVGDPTVIQKLDLLIIDEVSMVRADLLDAVDKSLRLNRNSAEPFGGVRILFVGDLFQLPPVVKQPEAHLFQGERYLSPFFFSAEALQSQEMTCVELTHVFRQEERRFTDLLEQVRESVSLDTCVSELNRLCGEGQTKDREDVLTLCCLNQAADEINQGRLASLPGSAQTYRATIEGEFPEEKHPCPSSLAVKPGARVLFCRNDTYGRWVNGTHGIVESLNLKSVRVRTRAGEVYQVDSVTWENYAYEFNDLNRRVTSRSVGKFTQIPLRLAWAVSIHRSQGLTLDEVGIDLADGAFAEGQVYVALSRCRSLEGITLLRPIQRNDIRTDRRVSWFHHALRGMVEDGNAREAVPDVPPKDHVEGFQIQLPDSVRERLVYRAEQEGCTVEAMIEQLIEEQFRARW